MQTGAIGRAGQPPRCASIALCAKAARRERRGGESARAVNARLIGRQAGTRLGLDRVTGGCANDCYPAGGLGRPRQHWRAKARLARKGPAARCGRRRPQVAAGRRPLPHRSRPGDPGGALTGWRGSGCGRDLIAAPAWSLPAVRSWVSHSRWRAAALLCSSAAGKGGIREDRVRRRAPILSTFLAPKGGRS